MKKFLLSLILLSFPLNAFAFDNCNLTLKKNEAYMLFIDEKPVEMVVSQPKVVNVMLSSDLYNVSHHIVIKTFSKGKTDIFITTVKGNKYTIKVDVEENPIISSEVFELDLPPLEGQ